MRTLGGLVGLLALASFGFFYRDAGFNQNTRFDLTRAIVERGTLAIDAYHTNTLDKALRDGHYYCDKPPAVSIVGVAGLAAVHHAVRAAGRDPTSPRAVALGFWAARMTAVSLFGALLAVAFLVTVAPHCTPAYALVLTAGLAFGTLVFPYSTVFYGHVPAAGLLFCAFAAAHAARRRGRPAPRSWLVAAGFAAGTAVAAEYQVALLAALLGLYLLATPAPGRALGWFAAGAAPPVLALLAYHAVCFGGPLSTGFAHEAMPYWREKYGAGLYGLGWPRAAALYQLTVGPRRGLLYQAPWLVLALPGLVTLARTPGWRPEAALVAAMTAVMLCLNASLHSWEGGWTMGARYLIPVVPFLAFAAAFARGRAARGVAAVLVPVSVLFMLAGAAVMPEVPILVADPLRDFLLPRLFGGGVSVPDPKGIAMNGGELLGLHGLASLVPLLGLWGAGGALALAAARRTAWPAAGDGAP